MQIHKENILKFMRIFTKEGTACVSPNHNLQVKIYKNQLFII